MTTQLSLIDNTDSNAQLEREGRVIAEATAIIDRRMFSRGPSLTDSDLVKSYLKMTIAQYTSEVFGVVFLDTRHRVIDFEILFHGSIDSASVYPRQVVKRSLAHNAAAVFLTHNHPSGDTEPSQADRVLTQRLKEALLLVEVRVLDHIIVGAGTPLSMAEEGCL